MHGAWGRDAVAQSALGPYAPRVWREAVRQRGTRVITIRRDLRRRPERDLRMVYVRPTRPGAGPGRAVRRTIDDLARVVPATEWLASGAEPHPSWEVDDDGYVLVCTNGRHDPCCATFGRPLVRHLGATRWADQVWECSHIGGDRFAANVVLLPDSLYFGHCDGPGVEAMLAAHDAGRLDTTSFRGRSTFTTAEQAVEHAVRAELGLDGLDAIAGMTRTDDEGGFAVVVRNADGERTVPVALRRTDVAAPTPLTCKGSPGQQYARFDVSLTSPT
ncbi:MAG: hypothetical protein H0U21_04675 [Acidimicrobiia bacterium]|nr:hypothetical protein [Acidimicrobiia bacterium]